jgi:1-acyl-sn-glycerol-3-phosphate acyltransferase
MEKAGRLIREKKEFSVAVLPEGTRTKTGKLGPFKKGGFLIAVEAGLDILPIVQLGADKIKKRINWIIRPGKIRVIIEKPIPTSDYNKENIKDLMEKTRNVFLQYVE